MFRDTDTRPHQRVEEKKYGKARKAHNNQKHLAGDFKS